MSDVAVLEFDFAALCAHEAHRLAKGDLLVREFADALQTVAERTGWIDAIGQDAVQDIMAEAIAAASLVPELAESDLADDLELEIALRTAELVRDWELADARDRWRHTGERRPIIRTEQPRREPYAPPASTIAAFWHVQRNESPDYLARWLSNHPADAPALYKIWKASRC
jgi:hypothetical protein